MSGYRTYLRKLGDATPIGVYSVDPQTARKAALYVAHRLGESCGDVLDALGLRDGHVHDRTHHRDELGKSIPNRRPPRTRR